jgi:hypothetical protein
MDLNAIMEKGRAEMADYIKQICKAAQDEETKRLALRDQYFATLDSALKAALPEPLWRYIDYSTIEMGDNGYMDTRPYAIFLSVPNCLPIRLSVWMYYGPDGWSKGGLIDGEPVLVPGLIERPYEGMFPDHRCPTELRLSRLPYALALAESRKQELDVLNPICQERYRTWKEEQDAKEACQAAKREQAPTAEEQVSNSLEELIFEIVDSALDNRGL